MPRRAKQARSRRSTARPISTAPAPQVRRETILVVDDVPVVRRLLRRRLEPAGYAVVEAADGGEALERCRERPVALVVTDLLMPGVGGMELVTQLRHEFPLVRVIAISGALEAAVVPMLAADSPLNGSRFLPKPFTTPQLLDAVRAALQS